MKTRKKYFKQTTKVYQSTGEYWHLGENCSSTTREEEKLQVHTQCCTLRAW